MNRIILTALILGFGAITSTAIAKDISPETTIHVEGEAHLVPSTDGKYTVDLDLHTTSTDSHAANDHGHHDEKVGLPQLDPKWFPSQIFWLAVTFAFMYIPFKFKILPDLSSAIERRREQIQGDLVSAKELRVEAENVHQTYNTILKDARDQASALFIRAEDKIKELEQQTFQDFYSRAAKKTDEAEKEVLDAKKNAMVTVNDIAADVATIAAEKIVGIKTTKTDATTVIKSLHKDKAA